jgi:hypothetical protein
MKRLKPLAPIEKSEDWPASRLYFYLTTFYMHPFFYTFLLLLFVSALYSQSVPIQQGDWQKATQGLDYSRDLPKPPAKMPNMNFGDGAAWTQQSAAWGKVLQIIAAVVAFLAIAYGIYRMMQAPTNKTIARDGVEITLENLEEYLHESDLDQFLRTAKAQGAFSLALRLYYLKIIKKLSEKKIVQWTRDKTNRDYVQELRQHARYQGFKNATQTYERVWYGNLSLNISEFERMEIDFQQLLAQI